MASKKGGLGRGLDALFADLPIYEDEQEEKDINKVIETFEKEEKTPEKKDENKEVDSYKDRVMYIGIHDIKPNEEQPRKHFDEEKLSDLADSILEHGIIQPVVVRKINGGYEIVAGERRWRAAMKAGIKKIPCIIKELTDEENMLIAIIENMQREDLNPLEEAEGLNVMISKYSMTQEQVSKSIGKSRPYITNSIRLLKSTDAAKEALSAGIVTSGHCRALLGVDDKNKADLILKEIIEKELSVRETEKLVSSIGKEKNRKKEKKKNPEIIRIEENLKQHFGTKIRIVNRGRKGKIEIDYFSEDDLNRILEIIGVQE